MADSNFIDYVKILCRSGKGGAGSRHYHRAKYIPKGGPDGGDGGRGGHIILKGNRHLWTLLPLRYRRHIFATNGESGGAGRSHGKDGQDQIVEVPVGTAVFDADSGEFLCEVTEDGQTINLLRGGKGGLGNWHFATSTNRAPRYAQPGQPAIEKAVVLELKLLGDVGLVGFPNAGKSTLLSAVSAAKPKVADYPFTTMEPSLGIVDYRGDRSFVMADIPGIIEGAAEGAGLGHDFLRHIDRCRLIVHIVDVSGSEGRDPVEDFEKINEELRQWSPELAARPMLVAANKTDLLPPESDNLERLRAHVSRLGCPFYEISAATTGGTRELMRAVAGKLSQLPPVTVYEPEYVKPLAEAGGVEELKIERFEDVWCVSGAWLERLIADVNFADYESRMYSGS